MAPEGHGAQVFLDPDLGSEKVTKSGVSNTLSLIKFSPKHTVEAIEAPWTPLLHPVP